MKGLVIMTNTKMTQEKALMFALELEDVKANKEVADKFADMLASVRNKRTNKTATKTQIRNEELKSLILELMVEDSLYTCTQVLKMLDEEDVTSQQKVTSLMASLIEDKKVERIKDKKTTYFKKVVA